MSQNLQAPPIRTKALDPATESGVSRPWLQHFNGITIKINAPVSTVPPLTANSAGTPGAVAVDANFAYFCYAPNRWRRVAVASW